MTPRAPRYFKTKWFARAARRAGIGDTELCEAVRQLRAGRGVDLGGGVWKQRLAGHRYRAIVMASGGERWVFEYLFAKQDRVDIDSAELLQFRRLARVYATLTEAQVTALKSNGDWREICDDGSTQTHV